MLLLEQQEAPLSLEAVGASDPVDVTGAGDTVIATYALAVASGASYPDAAPWLMCGWTSCDEAGHSFSRS